MGRCRGTQWEVLREAELREARCQLILGLSTVSQPTLEGRGHARTSVLRKPGSPSSVVPSTEALPLAGRASHPGGRDPAPPKSSSHCITATKEYRRLGAGAKDTFPIRILT